MRPTGRKSVSPPRGRNSLVLFILILIVAVLVLNFRQSAPQPKRLFFNEFAEAIQSGEVVNVVVDENDLEVTFASGEKAFTRKEPSKTAIEQLLDLGVLPAQVSSEASPG